MERVGSGGGGEGGGQGGRPGGAPRGVQGGRWRREGAATRVREIQRNSIDEGARGKDAGITSR